MAKNNLLRRGFKKEANDYSREYRAELGVSPDAPLCPRALAAHLEIPLIPLSFFSEIAPAEYAALSLGNQSEFFGLTVFHGHRRTIVFNDSCAEVRQTSDLAHELAHGILGHEPHELLDEDGNRMFNDVMEEEANWLGPALLVSEEAALRVARSRMVLAEAAEIYGVSVPVMRMRLNVTAAHSRVRR